MDKKSAIFNPVSRFSISIHRMIVVKNVIGVKSWMCNDTAESSIGNERDWCSGLSLLQMPIGITVRKP